MANYNFTVRAGFSVTLGAPNSNGAGSTVATGGQAVSLSDAQVDGHTHKLAPVDSPATTKLAAISSTIRIGYPNQF